ncbi:MAG: hypothetical protein E6Q88_09540 [Lysobacteraceae bacterium]|nr:MAG: hypothetical protein E6Q88_09540 [Xanthomonadaceae bacterium]
MKFTTLTTALLLSAPILLSSTAAGAAGPEASYSRTQRGELVHQIVKRWGAHVQEAYGTDVHRWAMEMVPVFAKTPMLALRNAADANDFDAMNNALLSGAAPSLAASDAVPGGLAAAKPRVSAKVLGDADKDLIFVPITPCRIIDTRIAGGAIAANTTRSFDVTAVSNYSFQGGDASDCNGVGSAGSFAAAAINFTVVTPGAAGYITAFPFGTTQPLAATVNYVAGDIRGNFAVVKLDQGASANELSVYSFAQTHLVADIVGYYRNPGAPTLECVSSGDTTDTVAAGATRNTVAPACPATYTQTATNCESSTWQMPFVYFADGICSAQNNSSGSAQLRASRTCCRPKFN